jgi:predicted TIM-barrel fold metal-dependent hydrolase
LRRRVTLPPFATDCHTHLFGPSDRFPYREDRAYTPSDAGEAEARRMLAMLGLERIVLVHASVYGDNRRLLSGLELLGAAARGVAVLGSGETAADLRDWAARGVAGVRINNVSISTMSPSAVADTVLASARRVADLGWHVQVLLRGNDLRAVLERAPTFPAPLVIDHFGHLSADAAEDQDLRDLLTDRLAAGQCWIKLSASYRLAGDGRAAARALTRRFIAANPERLLWGSDWPHPPENRAPEMRLVPQPFRPVDTARLLADFLDTVPETVARHRILVDNPAALYRF